MKPEREAMLHPAEALCGFFIAICITPQPSLETLGPFLPNIVVYMVFPLSR